MPKATPEPVQLVELPATDLPPGAVIRSRSMPDHFYRLPQGAVFGHSASYGPTQYAPSYEEGHSATGPWGPEHRFTGRPNPGDLWGWVCARRSYQLVDDTSDPWE